MMALYRKDSIIGLSLSERLERIHDGVPNLFSQDN